MSSPESEHLVNVLRTLRDEDAAGELAEVRGRVMAAIKGKKPSWWFAFRWRYSLVPAAAVAVAMVALSPRAQIPAPPAPPSLQLPAPVIAKTPPPPRVRRPAPEPTPAPQAPLLVKMFTDDPDVVIYWLIDAEGD
ncbi:MAG: hypothetical protein IT159_06820 [Bryobacterales bacterium]|nr:hypothetical protein [Bryobacterales bacterium]